MAKKSKKVLKSRASKKTTRKKGKIRVARKKTAAKKKTISPKSKEAARTPLQISARVMKTSLELQGLRQKFAVSLASGVVGACYFKDPSGGPDQCIPATEEDCKSEGGVWTPGNCPN